MRKIYSGLVVHALGLVLLGGAGCGGKVNIDRALIDTHEATAARVAEAVNASVEAGGNVLVVHRQADNPILDAWVTTLDKGLDGRFSTTYWGPADASQEARESYSGARIISEAVASHPDCVAIVSNVSIDPIEARALARGVPPIFALEWPFPDESVPLLMNGSVQAGVFEFLPAAHPGVTPDPGLFVGEKHLFLDKQSSRIFASHR